jgi:hypothetical protein
VFGFSAEATGVPVDSDDRPIIPVELSIPANYYARCLYALMHSAEDAPGSVTVNLQYSLDNWNTAAGSRTWNTIFDGSTRLVLTSGTQQMQGPIRQFAGYPAELDFRNVWATDGVLAKRVLIRPYVDVAADVFVHAEVVFDLLYGGG